MQRRWPDGVSARVIELIEHELELIADLEYEPYFLTVYDIVAFARSQEHSVPGAWFGSELGRVLLPGHYRGRSGRMAMLVERFISKERNEPPDIDVDFEHERREEVIQYIYEKYGRERAALAATVITYRPRSALRDVGKALGLSDLQVGRLARSMQWWDGQRSMTAASSKPVSTLTAQSSSDFCTWSGNCSAFRGTCRSMSAVSLSRTAACPSSCRSRMQRCRIAPSSSGKRPTSKILAC